VHYYVRGAENFFSTDELMLGNGIGLSVSPTKAALQTDSLDNPGSLGIAPVGS
jgi:hypothetical protein